VQDGELLGQDIWRRERNRAPTFSTRAIVFERKRGSAPHVGAASPIVQSAAVPITANLAGGLPPRHAPRKLPPRKYVLSTIRWMPLLPFTTCVTRRSPT
jgi:hypothetical protein